MLKYAAIAIVALGTYLARYLPMRLNLDGRLNEYLTESSIAMISALFIISLLSTPFRFAWIDLASLVAVFLSYRMSRNVGISVLIGVLTHLLISTLHGI